MPRLHTQGTKEAAYEQFLDAYHQYRTTEVLDEIRARDFSRLDEQQQVYLDYTGAGLYGASQIQRHSELLTAGIFGNPHSHHTPSVASTDLIEECRHRVLAFFNASPDLYTVIFTANASQALKLVGEAYPFDAGDQLLLTFDNHNSVNGIREFNRAKGAKTRYVPILPPDLVVDPSTLDRYLHDRVPERHNLFAYPAQSNFSGVQHPLEWIEQGRSLGWTVLLDAAAFAPTNRLDLSRWQPDYVALSFYKMFGHPTGVGALISRRDALETLHRPWFSGGTIDVASVQGDRHFMSVGPHAFEDGTVDYLSIPAVKFGLDLLDSVTMSVIHERVRCLTAWLLDQLQSLRHANGRRVVRLYGPITAEGRGGTVAFNLSHADGTLLDHRSVEVRASQHHIALRTGCFCNPGAGEVALGLSEDELKRCFRNADDRMDRNDLMRCINAESGGAVRISFGLVSNFSDAYAFLTFARGFVSTT